MNARNARREWHRANNRRNYLANEIAGLLAAGRTPAPRLVADWEAATARLATIPPKQPKTPHESTQDHPQS